MSQFKKQLKKRESSKPQAKSNVDYSTLLGLGEKSGVLLSLPPESFYPDPDQPRKHFDIESLASLRESIEVNGQLQPIVVNPVDDEGRYKILVGETRWRAISSSETVTEVLAVVREVGGESDVHKRLETRKLQISENEIRTDISVFELAEAYKTTVDDFKTLGINQAGAAEWLGISKAKLSKYLTVFSASSCVINLSRNNEVSDVEVLYLLAKASEISSEAVLGLVDKWRGDELSVSLRKAATDLLKALKSKEQADSHDAVAESASEAGSHDAVAESASEAGSHDAVAESASEAGSHGKAGKKPVLVEALKVAMYESETIITFKVNGGNAEFSFDQQMLDELKNKLGG